jgi:hypothetical protein
MQASRFISAETKPLHIGKARFQPLSWAGADGLQRYRAARRYLVRAVAPDEQDVSLIASQGQQARLLA